MQRPFSLVLLLAFSNLGGCGAGETAAQASLQAEQARQTAQQMQQLRQQVEAANEKNRLRLEQAGAATR